MGIKTGKEVKTPIDKAIAHYNELTPHAKNRTTAVHLNAMICLLADAIDVVKDVEFSRGVCMCGNYRSEGHAPGCKIAKVLKCIECAPEEPTGL